MKVNLKAVIGISALVMISSAHANGEAEVGWLENIRGRVDIVRNGRTISATNFVMLHKGDQVIATMPDSTASLMQPGKVTVIVDSKRALVIGESDRVIPPMIRNLLDWLSASLRNENKGQKYAIASTRAPINSKRISAPLFGYETFVVAGERKLSFSWQGGVPPFRLSIVKSDTGESIRMLVRLDDHHVTFDGLPAPGSYEFRLTDATGSVWEKEVLAVGPERIPMIPAVLQQTGLNQNALSAAWLAGAEGRIWTVEAYSRLKADWTGSEAETLVEELLKRGDSPPIGSVK